MAKKDKDDALEKQKTEMAEYELPEGMDDITGFEGSTDDDYKLALLLVLQSNSPQVDTVPGAKAGMFINSVTNELYEGKSGILFQPCARRAQYLEFIPRDNGGGFAGLYEPHDSFVHEAQKRHKEEGGAYGKLTTEEGNELVDTRTMLGYLIRSNGTKIALSIPFASTKIKHFKGWMSMAKDQFYPGSNTAIKLWGLLYRITTYDDKNKKGVFKNIQIMYEGQNVTTAIIPTMGELYREGYEFSKAAQGVDYTVNFESAQNQSAVDDVPDADEDGEKPSF